MEQTDGSTHNPQQIANRTQTTIHTDTLQIQTGEKVTTRARDVQHTVITRSKTQHIPQETSKRVMEDTSNGEVKPTLAPSKGEMADTMPQAGTTPSKRAMGASKRPRTQSTASSTESETESSEGRTYRDPLLTCHLTEPAQATRRRLLPLRDLSPATQYRTFNSWATEEKVVSVDKANVVAGSDDNGEGKQRGNPTTNEQREQTVQKGRNVYSIEGSRTKT